MLPMRSLIAEGTGFLPTRGSLMLDFVVVAMIVVLLGLAVSIYLVKRHRLYTLHKRIQIGLTAALLAAIVGFEVDMQLFTDWRELAEKSTWHGTGWIEISLGVHLLFAIPTPFVWTYVVSTALMRFPLPASPSTFSGHHKKVAWFASFMMLMTAVTGWIFYTLAFVM
jgi:putative membrane protein